jgi:hypothetical protein
MDEDTAEPELVRDKFTTVSDFALALELPRFKEIVQGAHSPARICSGEETSRPLAERSEKIILLQPKLTSVSIPRMKRSMKCLMNVLRIGGLMGLVYVQSRSCPLIRDLGGQSNGK